MHRNTAFIE